MTALLVTGATGFIGRQVLAALRDTGAAEVRCLSRRAPLLAQLPAWDPRWTAVSGDLLEPASYSDAIVPGSTVIHLAGAVGKRRPQEFVRQNVDATRVLVEAARERGASHFVFVSSIAAVYPDVPAYVYARTKRNAEQIVREAGIPFTILRPTIVLGPGSGVLTSLSRLALLPVPMVFGSGNLEVQPIHVDDVARIIVRAALERWPNETVDVGGPEVLTLDALIGRIRNARRGVPRPPLHLPLLPVRGLLSLIEPLAMALLPVSAGQLAAFEFSSRAAPHPRLGPLSSTLKPISAMVAA